SRRSRRPWIGRASLIALAGCLSWAVVWPAAAQDTCYRVVDLGTLGFTPNIDHIFGINNANQAVFTAEVGGKKHAMLYLPVDAFGLTAGVHDLHELAGAAIPGDESVAHDINAAGIAVGWGKIGGERHAFVWRLDLPVHQFIDLGTFATGVWSEAWAISDDSPDPWIVGKGEILGNCVCDDQGPQNHLLTRGFALELIDPPPFLTAAAELERDPGTLCENITAALDINNGPEPTAAGFQFFGGGTCTDAPPGTALNWPDPDPPAPRAGVALPLLPAGLGSVARGISNLEAFSGFAITSVPQSHAAYWDTVAGPIVDLGSLLAPGEQSWGWRINNNAPPGGVIQVVGNTGTLGEGLLWECAGNCDLVANWSFTDLNESIQHCSSTWIIRQAHDVNDNGWIIGVGNAPGQSHAILLTPLENCCDTDLNGDGTVGAADLLALLVAWGPCDPLPADCLADLDCDGSVGAADLLILLIDWGAVCNNGVLVGGGPVPRNVQDCIDRFCCDEEDLPAFEHCICLVDPECDITP
ncbi:MAG: hypothetical protein V3T84_04535, partial [Phycisphaerales bacterium]